MGAMMRWRAGFGKRDFVVASIGQPIAIWLGTEVIEGECVREKTRVFIAETYARGLQSTEESGERLWTRGGHETLGCSS